MYTIRRPADIPQGRLETILIYDYSDLAKLKAVIDYGFAVSERIRRRKRPDYINDIMTVDIESTTISAGTALNQSDKPFAFPYSYQIFLFGSCWILRTDAEFSDFIHAVNTRMIEAGATLPAYVHNLSYEYQFFKSRIEIDFESVFALQSRRIGKFETTGGGIEFRCSYLLSNMSLEKFTENYCSEEYRKDKELIDYEEIRFPWSALSESVLYYSAMDVITLYHAIKSIMEKEGDNVRTIPLTNTGYVRRSCRLACLGENTSNYKSEKGKKTYRKFRGYHGMIVKCMPTYEQYLCLVDAFRGGNTHANRAAAGQIIPDISSYDFASSYPAAIIAYDGFPMGKLMECTASLKTPEDINYYCRRYWVVIRALFKDLKLRDPSQTTCPYIPIAKTRREWLQGSDGQIRPRKGRADNGRLMEQEGYTEFTFLSCEWDIIRKQYTGQIYVKEAYYTVPGYLPDALRQTCFDWYKAKTELKNVDGMEYEYMKSKNRVNSVYGMMVEKVVKNIITTDDHGAISERTPTEEEARLQIEEYVKPRNRKFLLYQWGVTITAICRVRHMEIIDLFGKDFVYGDTDSVKVMNAADHAGAVDRYNEVWLKYAAQENQKIPIAAYTKEGELQRLGYLDAETGAHALRFVTLGAKKYAYEDDRKTLHITIAGVPKKQGAALLGRLENFRPGFKFFVGSEAELKDRQTWKKMLTYRDDLDELIEIDGHSLHLRSCIAMERTEYTLDITDEYAALISYDQIFEEDPEIWD